MSDIVMIPRGHSMSYMILSDLPIELFGNRIPAFEFTLGRFKWRLLDRNFPRRRTAFQQLADQLAAKRSDAKLAAHPRPGHAARR